MTLFTFSYSSFRSEALRRLQLAKNAFSLAAKTSTLSAMCRNNAMQVKIGLRGLPPRVTAISFKETDKHTRWL